MTVSPTSADSCFECWPCDICYCATHIHTPRNSTEYSCAPIRREPRSLPTPERSASIKVVQTRYTRRITRLQSSHSATQSGYQDFFSPCNAANIPIRMFASAYCEGTLLYDLINIASSTRLNGNGTLARRSFIDASSKTNLSTRDTLRRIATSTYR